MSQPEDDLSSDPFLDSIRRGDSIAWGSFVRHYRPYLYAVALKVLDDQALDDGTSVVQTGLGKAFERIHQFRGKTRAELLGWVSQVVANLARDRRSQQPHNGLPNDSELPPAMLESAPETALIRREEAARVRRAMDSLPSDYQAVLQYRYFDGLDYETIIRRMNRSYDAVRTLHLRALRRLEKELGSAE